METLEHDGLVFSVQTAPDYCIRAPWKEFDCHGQVRETKACQQRPGCDKSPGEVAVYSSRGRVFLYDFQGTIKRARAEGWGLNPADIEKLTKRFGRPPSKREVVAESVLQDMERMRGWCEGRWGFVVLSVELLDVEGKGTGVTGCLGGLESDDRENIEEEAQRIAEELAAQVGPAHSLTKAQRIREAV